MTSGCRHNKSFDCVLLTQSLLENFPFLSLSLSLSLITDTSNYYYYDYFWKPLLYIEKEWECRPQHPTTIIKTTISKTSTGTVCATWCWMRLGICRWFVWTVWHHICLARCWPNVSFSTGGVSCATDGVGCRGVGRSEKGWQPRSLNPCQATQALGWLSVQPFRDTVASLPCQRKCPRKKSMSSRLWEPRLSRPPATKAAFDTPNLRISVAQWLQQEANGQFTHTGPIQPNQHQREDGTCKLPPWWLWQDNLPDVQEALPARTHQHSTHTWANGNANCNNFFSS